MKTVTYDETQWKLVEKKTCFVLLRGNTVVATLAGPESEQNAEILAAMLAAAPTPSADWQAQQDAQDREDADILSVSSAIVAQRLRDRKDAERYRLLRRGQHWSVINGIGDALRADALDAAIDVARKEQP